MKKYITKQSSIKGAGKGLFTNASFKKGEVIGLAHVDDQPASEIGRNHNHNEENPTAYSKKINNKRYIYASKDLNPGEEITTNYRMQPELEQPEDFMRKGGSVLRLPNKKNSKGYSRSLSATNKLFTQNFLFAKPKSRKNKVFDPNSKYYAEGGESKCQPNEYWNGNECIPDQDCEDGRCEETDQIQKILDEGSYIPKKNVNIMWDVVDQSSIPELSGGDRKNARNIWTSKGAQSISERLGPSNAVNCMWAAGMGYQCLPETKGKIPLMPFESNDKFINAVNKGTIPFSRVAKTNNPNFASKETGMLRQGDIINFKGPGVSHAMTFSNYDDFGKPIFLDSNGNESDLNWNKGLWKNIIPDKETVAYVSRFDPEKFYEKDIKSLEEKARNNPTMIEKEYGGSLLTKKVTCKKCGWKWDAEDGGNDITTCHKCGGQGLVHAQNGNLNKFVGGGKPCDSGYYWNGKKCVLDTSNWEQSSLDSLNLYNKGEKSSGLYNWNYGLPGNHRALWRNESIKPLPKGYTVPGTIQPIGQKVTQATFPEYAYRVDGKWVFAGSYYKKSTKDVYKKPVGVQKKQVFNEEPKLKEEVLNLPILKPSLIQQQNYQLQGNTINEENLNLPNEEVESEYLNEGGPDTENPMEWVDKKRRYIDWNGKSLSYRLPRFRKPGGTGDLIKPGKKRYFHLPTIESRNEIYLRPKKQDGGAITPEEWGKEIKTIEQQIGSPNQWTLKEYYLLQNKLNAYKNWRENTPEGQAVIDSHNVEGEYNVPLPEHLQNYTNVMMKARLAYADAFGNPAAKRMINIPNEPYEFTGDEPDAGVPAGNTGTHFMSSIDNYAVPSIQQGPNGLYYNQNAGPEDEEAIRFDSDEDATYFAENYKDVSPGFLNQKQQKQYNFKSLIEPEEQSFLRNTEGPANYIEADLDEDEIEEYRRGGYIVEEIDNYQDGGAYTVKGSKGAYKKVNGKWQVDWNRSGKYQPLSKGDVKARTAVLDKMAKPVDNGISKISSNSSDNTRVNNIYQKPLDWSFDPKYKNNIQAFVKKSSEEKEKAIQKEKEDSKIMSGLANNEGIKETVGQYNRRKKKYDNLDLLGKMIENDPADNYMPQPVGRSPFEDSPMTGIGGAPKMILQAAKWLKPLWTATKTSVKAPLPLGKKITDATGGKLNLGNSVAAYFGADALYNQGDPNSDVVKSQSNFINNPSWNTFGDASFETGVNSLGFSGLGLGKQVFKPVIKGFKKYNWKQPQFSINKRFKKGGESDDYIELNLTPEEIQVYKNSGFIVEEIDNYQNGGFNKKGQSYDYTRDPTYTERFKRFFGMEDIDDIAYEKVDDKNIKKYKQTTEPIKKTIRKIPTIETKSNFELDLKNKLQNIAKENILKEKNISKVEPIKNSLQITKNNNSNIKNKIVKPEDSIIESAYKEIKSFDNWLDNQKKVFNNGLNRKLQTWGIVETKDKKVIESPEPINVKDYYKNPTLSQTILNVNDQPNRQFKQQTVPTSNLVLGSRNRGQYQDIESDGLEFTTFHPFKKLINIKPYDKKKNVNGINDDSSVFALDDKGVLHTGIYKNLKNNKDWQFSRTFMNKIVSIDDISLDGSRSGNHKFWQPQITILENNKLKKGALNILTKKGKAEEDYYGSILGGRVVFVNPTTKEQTLVSGSVSHIKKEFKKLKGNNKYLEAWSLDNGTYARGLSYKDGKLTKQRLVNYDAENTSGGNGLYIKKYNVPVNKFKEEYIYDMPNVRTKKDDSYKAGHKLKNEIKNFVLHHTAYNDPITNNAEVKKQFMTPGQNSSHVVIEEDGSRTIYASPEQISFHAGKSKWNGREDVNDFSIGVEFQGDTQKKPLTDQQVISFVEYYAPIAKKYNLNLKSIITHEQIRNAYIKKHANEKGLETKPDITYNQYKRILNYMKAKGIN